MRNIVFTERFRAMISSQYHTKIFWHDNKQVKGILLVDILQSLNSKEKMGFILALHCADKGAWN